MTTSTAVQRPDTHDMIVVHRVFRRESDLMPTLIQAVPDGDTARADVLADALRRLPARACTCTTPARTSSSGRCCWPGSTWKRTWCCGWKPSTK